MAPAHPSSWPGRRGGTQGWCPDPTASRLNVCPRRETRPIQLASQTVRTGPASSTSIQPQCQQKPRLPPTLQVGETGCFPPPYYNQQGCQLQARLVDLREPSHLGLKTKAGEDNLPHRPWARRRHLHPTAAVQRAVGRSSPGVSFLPPEGARVPERQRASHESLRNWCMCIRVCVCACVCVHVCIVACVRGCACACVCMGMWVHVHVCVGVHVHVCIVACACICMCACL